MSDTESDAFIDDDDSESEGYGASPPPKKAAKLAAKPKAAVRTPSHYTGSSRLAPKLERPSTIRKRARTGPQIRAMRRDDLPGAQGG